MHRAVMLAVVAALAAVSEPAAAQVYSCRGYPPAAVVSQIKTRVEALRMIEREAADRMAGLDTRSYEWLLERARTGAGVIDDPVALAAEDDLKRCRNYIQPVRRDCAGLAAMLVRVIEELAGGAASKESKQAYAQAMPQCERSMRLTPLNTALRTTD